MRLPHEKLKILAAIHFAVIGLYPYLFWMIKKQDWSNWQPFVAFEILAIVLLLINNRVILRIIGIILIACASYVAVIAFFFQQTARPHYMFYVALYDCIVTILLVIAMLKTLRKSLQTE